VLCDRYVASSCVLQRLDRVPMEFIEALNADADRPAEPDGHPQHRPEGERLSPGIVAHTQRVGPPPPA
jgi:hypothetical protein